MKTEIGGDRLGSGNKQEVSLRNYERSSHDLGYIWRSSMASGTLVPFMSEVALPGDSFDIDLDCDVKTLPTIGPLFGSYKVQLDVFQCPVRLYNGKLHMNMLNIGMDMSRILLPQLQLRGDYDADGGDNQQINSSSIYSYLNIRGLGQTTSSYAKRFFNAIPYLGYWDIYKNYYANKQEERGYVIHATDLDNAMKVITAKLTTRTFGGTINEYGNINNNEVTVDTSGTGGSLEDLIYNQATTLVFHTKYNNSNQAYGKPNTEEFTVKIAGLGVDCVTVFEEVIQVQNEDTTYTTTFRGYSGTQASSQTWESEQTTVENTEEAGLGTPQLVEFPLDNIDDMRMDILEAVRNTTAFNIDKNSESPYGLGLDWEGTSGTDAKYYARSSQEGLGIKTYQSDLFNNWTSTEWIDGSNGINEVTAVDTSGGDFTIDSLNLANKVYNMLNRIAISGGSYDDWLDAVYMHERAKSCENPIYHGSLIKELAFEEVVSMSDTTVNGEAQPLGTLAGRGRLTGKNKGGKVKIKVDEPSYIIGLVSLTPRIDYSQENKWDTNLKTMNDLHKPALDAIGYQDLITDQMAWFDSEVNNTGDVTYNTAGKQPAWINYMTNVNQTRGSFAEDGNSMFMTLNRRYEHGTNGIEDLTTYVDPSKYNNIFADEALDSQNFWVQISNRILARRKMSAKVIPNL